LTSVKALPWMLPGLPTPEAELTSEKVPLPLLR